MSAPAAPEPIARMEPCVWCGEAFPEDELTPITGTVIALCRRCTKRYEGVEGDEE